MNRLRRSSIQNVNAYCVHNLSNTGTNPTNIVPDEYKWSFLNKNDYLYNDHVQHSSDGAKNSLGDISQLDVRILQEKYSFKTPIGWGQNLSQITYKTHVIFQLTQYNGTNKCIYNGLHIHTQPQF